MADELPFRRVGEAQHRVRRIVARVSLSVVFLARVDAAVAVAPLIHGEDRVGCRFTDVPTACALHVDGVDLRSRAALAPEVSVMKIIIYVYGEKANFTGIVLGWLAGRSFSAVSKPIFATKYLLESSRRDLQNALFAPFWNRIPKTRKTMWGKEPGPTPGKLARRSS